ncbi:unnamed protein product [Linum trigynum]|uniref:Uncharacterized protein n=1 Tax=Linum trigynum TaxID=586398 RepID=A0AAV2FPG2_9ROSI
MAGEGNPSMGKLSDNALDVLMDQFSQFWQADQSNINARLPVVERNPEKVLNESKRGRSKKELKENVLSKLEKNKKDFFEKEIINIILILVEECYEEMSFLINIEKNKRGSMTNMKKKENNLVNHHIIVETCPSYISDQTPYRTYLEPDKHQQLHE